MHDETLRNTLSERFEGFSNQPSDAVWESIEKVLDEDEKAAGYRFNLLSPLVITLLIGSSAAALALIVYFTNTETTSTFPLADSYRRYHSSISDHAPLTLAADEKAVSETIEHHAVRIQQSTPTLPQTETAQRHTPFEIETLPLLSVKSINLLDISENGFCNHYIISECDPHIPETMHFYGAGKEEYYLPESHASNSSLSAEFLLSSFVNLSRNPSAYEPSTPKDPSTLNSSKTVVKSNRFVEAELNFNGHFSKRIKGGVGVSVAYSAEEGSVTEYTDFTTTQWTIGIPVTLGMDVWRGGRFSLGVAAKLLNDFDQRKTTEHTVLTYQSTFSPTILESTEVSNDQVYRFGFQPMITGSYYLTPRTALTMGISYRYYLKDSRASTVNFQRSPYLGVSLGLGFML